MSKHRTVVLALSRSSCRNRSNLGTADSRPAMSMSNSSHPTRLLAVIAFAGITGCAPSFTNPSQPQPSGSIASRSADTPEARPHEPTTSFGRSDSSGSRVQPSDAGSERGASTLSPKKQHHGQTLDEMLLFFPSKYPDGNWKPEGLSFEDAW